MCDLLYSSTCCILVSLSVLGSTAAAFQMQFIYYSQMRQIFFDKIYFNLSILNKKDFLHLCDDAWT